MPKDGVYKKRSNPNKETKHSYCDNPKSKRLHDPAKLGPTLWDFSLLLI